MTMNFRPGLAVKDFVLDGLERYRMQHGGESPAELVLHPEHHNALYDELPWAPPPWVPCESTTINGVELIEDPYCRLPYFVSKDRQRWVL